jgi:hypothetical protein
VLATPQEICSRKTGLSATSGFMNGVAPNRNETAPRVQVLKSSPKASAIDRAAQLTPRPPKCRPSARCLASSPRRCAPWRGIQIDSFVYGGGGTADAVPWVSLRVTVSQFGECKIPVDRLPCESYAGRHQRYLYVLTGARNASTSKRGASDCDVRWSDR